MPKEPNLVAKLSAKPTIAGHHKLFALNQNSHHPSQTSLIPGLYIPIKENGTWKVRDRNRVRRLYIVCRKVGTHILGFAMVGTASISVLLVFHLFILIITRASKATQ